MLKSAEKGRAVRKQYFLLFIHFGILRFDLGRRLKIPMIFPICPVSSPFRFFYNKELIAKNIFVSICAKNIITEDFCIKKILDNEKVK